jgi:hypothetical protein
VSVVPKIQEFFKQLTDPTTTIGKQYSDLIDTFMGVFDWLSQNWQMVSNLAIAYGALAGALKIATTMQAAFDLAMDANPIGLAVAGVLALTAALIGLYQLVASDKGGPEARLDAAAKKAGDAAYQKALQDPNLYEQTNTGPVLKAGAAVTLEKARQDAILQYKKDHPLPKPKTTSAEENKFKFPDFTMPDTSTTISGGSDPVASYITATGNKVKDALTKYHNAIIKANQDFATAVQKQITDFRTVFQNATQTNVATLFNQGFRSVDQLTAQLQTKLAQANQLAADATKLSAAGYSAEFIKQVMSEGAVAGDQMAQSLLAATPEQAKKLQALYQQTNDAAANGVNDLSVQISDQFQTSTQALAKAMNNAAVTLKESLHKISRSVSQEGAKTGATGRLKPLKREVSKDEAYANQQIINVTANSTNLASPQAVADAIVASIKFNFPLSAVTQ